jgi:Ca2+-binding EF-hand superfamily protein
MVLFPDAPSAQPWEFVLVDKIFQKGGDGAQGISRFLQRHVRSSDATPPGAILRADFRRTIAELNVACDEASYAAVAAACAFQPPRGSISSREDFADACLSVRELAARLANIARSGSGISAVYAPVENSPMTGFATARVPASTRREARARAVGSNDPDYCPPTRGLPSSPRAPAASSDPNSLLYDNPAGGGDWVGSPGRKETAASSKNEDEFEFVGSPPAKSSFDSPGRDSQSGMGGFANLRIDVPGDDEPKIPMSPRSPKGMSPLSPARDDGFNGDAPADDAALVSPDRAAMRRNEAIRARASKSGEVLEKSVTPLFEYPSEHFASDAFPSLDTVEAVEEAMRAALLTRTTSRAAAMRLVAGMHPQGGRLRAGDALTLDQFKLAMRRVNVMPASEAVTEAVFRKHDLDGNGSLDYQEFIRYLMPSDFEPVSPSVYRASYPGYTQPAPDPRRSAASGRTRNTAVTPAGAVPRDRDARMRELDPRDAATGKATAGAPTYEHGAFHADPTHDLTARRAEAAMLDKLRGENGGDATTRHFVDAFKFFDDDGVGVLDVTGFRRALRRLNVDPSDALFQTLVARHETRPGSGVVDYRAMASRVVPPSAQETQDGEKADGRVGERWGAEGTDRLWAGYDRVRLAASLEKLQEPSVFDRGRAGDAGYVPLISDIRDLEALLREKTLERTSNSGKGARAWWKYFDRDGSGAMDRGEFETAMARFNIAAAPEVVDEIMRKYDSNGDGEIDYCEMLRCLVPEGVRDRQRDTVASMRNMRHFGTSDVTVETQAVKAPPLTLGAPRAASAAEPQTHRVSAPAFQKMLLEWMRARGRGLAGLRKLFRQMDGDGDGRLDRDEFTRGLAMMNIHPTPGDLRAILARYDANGDGSIQFDEFIARVLPEHENPGYLEGNWQSIAHHDPKPANILPKSQGLYAVDFDNLLQRKIMSKADKMGSARQVFRELDYDRSGFVSPEEFRKWLVAMNFFPDEDAFQKLWRRYDPEGKGFMDYDHFVRRVTPRHDPTKSVF